MIKKLQFISLMAAMRMLQRCFKKEVPQCSDKQIVNMVKEIYSEHMQKNDNSNILAQILLATVPKKVIVIQAVRTIAYE